MSTEDESALPPFVPDEECPFHWGPSDNFGDCTCLSTAHLVRHAAISLHKAQLAIKLMGSNELGDLVLAECAKYGLETMCGGDPVRLFPILMRHLEANYKVTIGSYKMANDFLREQQSVLIEQMQAGEASNLPCPHARPSWRECPHCLGVNT